MWNETLKLIIKGTVFYKYLYNKIFRILRKITNI